MGRHTRKPEPGEAADEDEVRAGRNRWLGKVPLLPAVTGVLAIGAIVSAVSTKQISLNFAGAAPPSAPRMSGSVPSHGGGNALTRGRASRGASRSPVTATFRRTLVGTTGFHGEVTLVNRGTTTVTGWKLAFRYAGTRVTSVSGAVLAHAGVTTVVRNLTARPSIAPGQVVRVTFIAHGTARAPYLCLFNGKTC